MATRKMATKPDSLVENIEVGRVAGWCVSFDRVLADPLGVQCFHVSIMDNAHENVAVERQ